MIYIEQSTLKNVPSMWENTFLYKKLLTWGFKQSSIEIDTSPVAVLSWKTNTYIGVVEAKVYDRKWIKDSKMYIVDHNSWSNKIIAI